MQNVYEGMPGVAQGTVKRLRVVGVPPKTQPYMNQPNIGVSGEDPAKYVLGTVPVEADGSAYFRVPSGVSLFFQALDAAGTGRANDAEPDLRATATDAFLHRLPRIAGNCRPRRRSSPWPFRAGRRN